MSNEVKAIGILTELTGNQTICKDDDLREDLGLDSLAVVMLLVELEELLETEFSDSDLYPSDLKTVEDIFKLVQRYEKDGDKKS